ncbi:hypothetical protein O181_108288 [Austropuccinia psidii MF-1]|uniref:Uncharacterized protein n=1 Tax=Austropuccinia psidii MF-1 TaxID=1389203 RepID=A0A9Q3JU18_9BASI|nr:hypothetical protein [Austropuccinia psidii MF-1]
MRRPSSSVTLDHSNTPSRIFSAEYIQNMRNIDQMQLRKRQILRQIDMLKCKNESSDEEIALLERELNMKEQIIQQLQSEILQELNDLEAHLHNLM